MEFASSGLSWRCWRGRPDRGEGESHPAAVCADSPSLLVCSPCKLPLQWNPRRASSPPRPSVRTTGATRRVCRSASSPAARVDGEAFEETRGDLSIGGVFWGTSHAPHAPEVEVRWCSAGRADRDPRPGADRRPPRRRAPHPLHRARHRRRAGHRPLHRRGGHRLGIAARARGRVSAMEPDWSALEAAARAAHPPRVRAVLALPGGRGHPLRRRPGARRGERGERLVPA